MHPFTSLSWIQKLKTNLKASCPTEISKGSNPEKFSSENEKILGNKKKWSLIQESK